MDITKDPPEIVKKDILNKVLSYFKLGANCTFVIETNNCTFYDVVLKDGCSVKKFQSRISDIQLRLKSEHPIHIEHNFSEGGLKLQVINKPKDSTNFYDSYKITQTPEGKEAPLLPFFLGFDYYDNLVETDLAENPHILLGGSTGSGKTIALHCLIANALMNDNVDIYLGDPKSVEFHPYKQLHEVVQVANSYEEHISMLLQLNEIMEQRFEILKKHNATKISQVGYLPKIIVIIDEIADLMLQDDRFHRFEKTLTKLCQKCRAAGIFIIIATQRPSVNIVSGSIKANFPARISCKVSSKIDSKVIMDEQGADDLIGKGDAIIKNYQHNIPLRFRFPFVDSKEIIARQLLKYS